MDRERIDFTVENDDFEAVAEFAKQEGIEKEAAIETLLKQAVEDYLEATKRS